MHDMMKEDDEGDITHVDTNTSVDKVTEALAILAK